MGNEPDHKRMIRDLMAHHQWRQSDLAEHFDPPVGQGQISKWLRDQIPTGRFWLELRRLHDAAFDHRHIANDRKVVTVRGFIGAGAEIMPDVEQVPEEGLYDVELELPVPADAKAFEVRGESMWPRFNDGDVIVCWTLATSPEQAYGWEAAVQTMEGKRYVKRVSKSDKAGLFTLQSHNAPPLFDQKLEWIAKVNLIVPNGGWRRL